MGLSDLDRRLVSDVLMLDRGNCLICGECKWTLLDDLVELGTIALLVVECESCGYVVPFDASKYVKDKAQAEGLHAKSED